MALPFSGRTAMGWSVSALRHRGKAVSPPAGTSFKYMHKLMEREMCLAPGPLGYPKSWWAVSTRYKEKTIVSVKTVPNQILEASTYIVGPCCNEQFASLH